MKGIESVKMSTFILRDGIVSNVQTDSINQMAARREETKRREGGTLIRFFDAKI